MGFDSRYTPQTTASGFQAITLNGATQLLSTLATIPDEANSALIQLAADASFGFVLDGTVGLAGASCMAATELRLVNRQQILSCALANNGGGTAGRVQFFTGRSGAGIYPPSP